MVNMVILFDQYNLPENIYDIIFATKQQVIVAQLLVEEMKKKDGEMGKTEMSMFATALHDGKIYEEVQESPLRPKKKVALSYNKRQFYDRMLTPMKGMGLISYDMYKKKYRISDNFNRALTKIALMWTQEINKKPQLNIQHTQGSLAR